MIEIEVEEWRFGGEWLHILSDNHIYYATEILQQLYAQMMGWA